MNERRLRAMSRKLDEALDEKPPETPPRGAKWVLASKTTWVGIITTLIAILQLFGQTPDLARYDRWILLAVGVLVIVLRQLTTQPVTLTPPKDGDS